MHKRLALHKFCCFPSVHEMSLIANKIIFKHFMQSDQRSGKSGNCRRNISVIEYFWGKSESLTKYRKRQGFLKIYSLDSLFRLEEWEFFKDLD